MNLYVIIIITGLICTATIGALFGLASVGGFPEKHEWGKKIIATILAFVIGFGIAGLLTLEAKHDANQWNGGKCPNCNVKWSLASVDHIHNGGTYYYYVCDECGKIIEQRA